MIHVQIQIFFTPGGGGEGVGGEWDSGIMFLPWKGGGGVSKAYIW